MKKNIYVISFFLVLQAYANAQASAIDSMKQLLQTEKTDTARAILLSNLSRIYVRFRPDTALLLAQEALSLAKKTGFGKGEVVGLIAIGTAFQHTGNYPKALMYFLESLNKAESINDQKGVAKAYKGIYVNYSARGDERQAVNYALQTVALNKRLHDDNAAMLDMLNLADGYMILNIMDSAKWYNTRGYDFAVQQKDTFLIGFALNNFGNIYSKTGPDMTALTYYRSGLIFLQQARDVEAISETYLGMAKIFERANRPDSGLYYAKLSLSTAKQGSFTKYIMNACDFLTGYYATLHKTDSAFAYQSAAIAAKDSLFNQEKAKEVQALSLEEAMREQQTEETKIHYKNQLKFSALLGGIFCLLIGAALLYRNNRHKQKANILLATQKQKIEDTLQELKSTQAQLIQSEKMASLGELTAGIAHEIQNPLNFVNNFSEVSNELIQELKTERSKNERNEQAEDELLNDISQNLEKINHHGKRADSIVKGMLQHSLAGTGVKEPTDINALADEYLRLAYHGLRGKDNSFNVTMETDFDETVGTINIIPQNIGRVLLNLYNNAFYAVNEKKKQQQDDYEPMVSVSTKKTGNKILISVKDNGNGISQKVLDKIFQPFFTTKPTGQGTGLGLSLAYDIVKAHGGEIKVETKEGEGSEFIIQLPVV